MNATETLGWGEVKSKFSIIPLTRGLGEGEGWGELKFGL